MKPPIKNCRWVQYPLGDVTQFIRENVALYRTMGLEGHNGVDLVRPHGEHMFAVEDGTVKAVKLDPGGYGRHVRLWNKSKTREWTYGHCDAIFVKEGQEVKEGQFIATMGNTGFVVSGNTPYWEVNPYAGTHVHFGLRLWKNGEIQNYDNGVKGAVDPIPYFLDPKLKSTKIYKLASARQDKTLFQLAELLQKIGL